MAVGDPAHLKAAFDDGNALADLKSRATVYGVVLKINNQATFDVAANNYAVCGTGQLALG